MFETERLIIREYSPEDFTALHEIFSDAVTMQFWPEPFTEEQTSGWIDRSITNYKASGSSSPLGLTGYGRRAVILKEGGKLIGDAGIIKLEVNGMVENDLGYIIHKDFWRMGYGFEATKACLDYGLGELGLNRLVANMAHDNVASIKVAEKIGMKKECEFYNKRNRGILTYLYAIGK